MVDERATLVDHPLIQHKLTIMRDVTTPTAKFRQLLREVSLLLAYEVCRDLDTELVNIQTPLETMEAPKLEGKKLCLVSILRAGNGLLDGMLDLIPSARVGHVGLYRDPKTLMPVEYYLAAAAVQRIKDSGAKHIKFVCLLASLEGIDSLASEHPDVPIFTAAIDRELNEHGYILPGLGDAGDRMFGTK